MVKRLLIPVMVLAVCVVAKGQGTVSAATSTRSYSGSLGASSSSSYSPSSSSGFSSHTSSYSASRYVPANHFSGGNQASAGSSSYNVYRYQSANRYGSNRAALSPDGNKLSFADALAAEHKEYVLMDDKYALAPLPKTVPTSNTNPQRGDNIVYTGGGTSGGGGLQGNPFYTPGFSACNTANDSHDYQKQFMNFVQGRSLYGLPWYSWTGRRYIYWNYWRSNLNFMCQESMQLDLARAKTPGEVVEVMRSYYRCLRTIDGENYYNHFYPVSGGWGW